MVRPPSEYQEPLCLTQTWHYFFETTLWLCNHRSTVFIFELRLLKETYQLHTFSNSNPLTFLVYHIELLTLLQPLTMLQTTVSRQ